MAPREDATPSGAEGLTRAGLTKKLAVSRAWVTKSRVSSSAGMQGFPSMTSLRHQEAEHLRYTDVAKLLRAAMDAER